VYRQLECVVHYIWVAHHTDQDKLKTGTYFRDAVDRQLGCGVRDIWVVEDLLIRGVQWIDKWAMVSVTYGWHIKVPI